MKKLTFLNFFSEILSKYFSQFVEKKFHSDKKNSTFIQWKRALTFHGHFLYQIRQRKFNIFSCGCFLSLREQLFPDLNVCEGKIEIPARSFCPEICFFVSCPSDFEGVLKVFCVSIKKNIKAISL